MDIQNKNEHVEEKTNDSSMQIPDEQIINNYHYQVSDRFKIRMNRLFRILDINGKIPHPEVDTRWERIKSRILYQIHKIILKFKRKK